MVWQLDDDLWFPDPRLGDDDGCIAFGGDLSVDRLLLAYQHGIFPWFAYRTGEPVWYCPMQRFVIFPDEIHVSHSMRTLMNKGRYRLSLNEDFEGVISNCSQLRIDEDGVCVDGHTHQCVNQRNGVRSGSFGSKGNLRNIGHIGATV